MEIPQWFPSGKNFIGNINVKPKIVHDLSNKDKKCRLNEIKSDHIETFDSDSIKEANELGFKDCSFCIIKWPSLNGKLVK